MSDATAAFRRSVDERFAILTDRVNKLRDAFASADLATRVTAVNATSAAINDLFAILAEEDTPAWIRHLKKAVERFPQRKDHANELVALLNSLIAAYPHLTSHEWDFDSEGRRTAVDFEAVYQHEYEALDLPALFDKLIAELIHILETGAIDSIRATAALQDLIDTIRANARGSYYSTQGMWHLSRVFLKNYLWSLSDKSTVIGPFVTAARAVYDEINTKMLAAKQATNERVEKTAETWIAASTQALPDAAPLRLRAGAGDAESDSTDSSEE